VPVTKVAAAIWLTSALVVTSAAGVGFYQLASSPASSAPKSESSSPTLGGGNVTQGNGNGNNGNAAGGGSPGKAFTMTVQAVGTVGPGQHQLLNVEVGNPNNQNMLLTGASGVVTGVSKAGCLASWFTVENWKPGATPTLAPANGHVTVQMRLTFADVNTNQDLCKSTTASPVRISFTLNATGQQA
jgi:hypothetical protein